MMLYNKNNKKMIPGFKQKIIAELKIESVA